MEGWTEKEIQNRNLMAPCGLYCGACGIYIATTGQPHKLRGKSNAILVAPTSKFIETDTCL